MNNKIDSDKMWVALYKGCNNEFIRRVISKELDSQRLKLVDSELICVDYDYKFKVGELVHPKSDKYNDGWVTIKRIADGVYYTDDLYYLNDNDDVASFTVQEQDQWESEADLKVSEAELTDFEKYLKSVIETYATTEGHSYNMPEDSVRKLSKKLLDIAKAEINK